VERGKCLPAEEGAKTLEDQEEGVGAERNWKGNSSRARSWIKKHAKINFYL
jgi:hypothetical protein